MFITFSKLSDGLDTIYSRSYFGGFRRDLTSRQDNGTADGQRGAGRRDSLVENGPEQGPDPRRRACADERVGGFRALRVGPDRRSGLANWSTQREEPGVVSRCDASWIPPPVASTTTCGGGDNSKIARAIVATSAVDAAAGAACAVEAARSKSIIERR